MHYVQVWSKRPHRGDGWWLVVVGWHVSSTTCHTERNFWRDTQKVTQIEVRLDGMFLPEIRKLPFSPYPELYPAPPTHPLADPGQNRIRDGHREAVKGKLGYYGLVQNALALPCCKDEQIKFSSFGGWRICIFLIFFQIRSLWNDSQMKLFAIWRGIDLADCRGMTKSSIPNLHLECRSNDQTTPKWYQMISNDDTDVSVIPIIRG